MTSGIGRNYARALFDLAVETGRPSCRGGGPRHGARPLYTDKDVRAFLGNKLIGRTTKKNIFHPAFEGKVDSRLMVLLSLLANRGRTELLDEIAEEYARLSRLARACGR